jgi:serine/threonine-protein kinase
MAEQRYRVIERLEAGGMAEVFVGEATGAQGFKKRVAIKRVLPHLAQNKRFISMFLDEARLGARLNHANIVSVFDIGAADNTYFIVMELVDGANLKTIMESLRKQGRRFPVKAAIYICMEACRGLSYAHELQDDDGADLGIVHRDVSPPNIMITRRGEVKVADFGLARASTQLEKTDPGVVKGKFSYLSPEAALGEQVDARTDVFALGIVLWEMIAGRRLVLGESDFETVKMVQQASVPSLQTINPEADSAFEAVLGKALSRDPAQRFQSARDLGDALAGYLFSHQMKVTSYDIAALVGSVVSDKKAEKPKADPSIIDRLIQEELLRFTSLEEITGDPLDGGAPLSPDDVEGAKPIDLSGGGGFENPADWFSNDEEVAAAVGGAELAARTSTPGWREAGMEPLPDGTGDLANMLEAEDRHPSSRPPRRSEPTPAATTPAATTPGPITSASERASLPPARTSAPQPAFTQPARTSQPGAAPGLQPTPPTSAPPVTAPPNTGGSRLALVAVVVLVVLAGAGAAAWFGGLIPH